MALRVLGITRSVMERMAQDSYLRTRQGLPLSERVRSAAPPTIPDMNRGPERDSLA